MLLLAWQVACPSAVFLNRGNHEAVGDRPLLPWSHQWSQEAMNLKDGFHQELMEKYKDPVLFDLFEGMHAKL